MVPKFYSILPSLEPVMKIAFGLLSALISPAVIVAIAPATFALSAPEVSQIAKDITVRIESQTPGSGVLIKRDGSTYTLLTAAHVVGTADDYEVVTQDNQRYRINSEAIKTLPGVDLAILQFSSDRTYKTAKLGNAQKMPEGSASYVAGFPLKSQALTETIYNFTEGKITANANRALKDGYSLVYSNNTLPGMSGGPVLNSEGHLLGIHGRADTTDRVLNQSINPDIFIKTGFNLGIPVNTFLSLVPKTGVDLGFQIPAAAVSSVPSVDDVYLQALDHYERGDIAPALSNSTQAIRLDANFAPAYSLRGSIRYLQEDQIGALEDFNRALKLDSEMVSAYLGRGLIQSALGDPQSAMADYSQVIQRNSRHARAYYNRGVLHLNQGQQQDAMSDLRAAADISLQEDNQAEYQRAVDALKIASKSCRQSIRSICDR
jgi:serine protease Do